MDWVEGVGGTAGIIILENVPDSSVTFGPSWIVGGGNVPILPGIGVEGDVSISGINDDGSIPTTIYAGAGGSVEAGAYEGVSFGIPLYFTPPGWYWDIICFFCG